MLIIWKRRLCYGGLSAFRQIREIAIRLVVMFPSLTSVLHAERTITRKWVIQSLTHFHSIYQFQLIGLLNHWIYVTISGFFKGFMEVLFTTIDLMILLRFLEVCWWISAETRRWEPLSIRFWWYISALDCITGCWIDKMHYCANLEYRASPFRNDIVGFPP